MLQVVTSDNLEPSNEGRDSLTARLKQLTLLKYKQVYCFFYHWQWKGMTYCLGNTTVDMKMLLCCLVNGLNFLLCCVQMLIISSSCCVSGFSAMEM